MGTLKTCFLSQAPSTLVTFLLLTMYFEKDMFNLIYEKSELYSGQKFAQTSNWILHI